MQINYPKMKYSKNILDIQSHENSFDAILFFFIKNSIFSNLKSINENSFVNI